VREVAGGAMGVVFEARHTRLDRRVALKVLRPEMATAVAAERFVAEGRILARLSHRSIVRVFDAGEKKGFLYYAMEFVEGESLADRLKRGALPPAEAIRLGHDLLGALEAAHGLGVVHRDIKPANIFLREGRALLGDFGVARWQRSEEAGNTTPGELIGTLRYMSPEQRDGVPASKRTDVYAAGLVIWEACTGERWDYQSPDAAEWSPIPSSLVAPLRRALALAPEERWADAAEMRRAHDRSTRMPQWPLALAGTAVAALVAWLFWPEPREPPSPRGAVSILVANFRPEPGSSGGFADSVSAALRVALEYPDFYVLPAGATDSAMVQVGGSVAEVEGEVRVLAQWRAGTASDTMSTAGARGDWDAVAEQLALKIVRSLWRRDSLADTWLPVNTLPSNDLSFAHWLRGEQLLTQARWDEAYLAFKSAEQADSTCYLCTFRILDIDRWLGEVHEPARLTRLQEGIGRFTPPYQRLIRAALAPLPERLDTLSRAAEARDFVLASFQYGDELFHRGPLHGRSRSEALEPFRHAVQLRPRFAPGWEHLTWLELSEGDSGTAKAALDSLLGIPAASTGFAAALPFLLRLGYHWRFLTPDSARRFSRAVLSMPGIASLEEAAAGARLLMTADAPRGAVEFGGMLITAWPDRPGAPIEGLLGQLFGYAATGRLDSLRGVGDRLGRYTDNPAYPLLAYELEALLRTFDPEPAVRVSPEGLRRALDRYLVPRAFARELRERAAWASGLVAIRSGDTLRARIARETLGPGADPLRALLAAADLAERGDAAGALGVLPAMPALDTPGESPDPLLDAAVRLLRAELLGRQGDHAGERSALLWYQHLQTIGRGTGRPQPGEIGWAAGTLARWRLAGQSVSTGTAKERCAAWAAVARNWATGDPPFRARADSAGRAASRPDC
jgi:serine/threonine protein kinase